MKDDRTKEQKQGGDLVNGVLRGFHGQMYSAAVKQACERSEREGETMVIYRRGRGTVNLPIWYVRSVAEGEPQGAVIVEIISCST